MTTNPQTAATPDVQRLMAELQFLTELSTVVASHTELQPILDWMVQKTTAMFGADEGSIKLLGPELTEPTVKTLVAQRDPGKSSGSWPPAIATNVMGFLMAKNEPLATPDLTADPRFVALKGADTRIRAVLAVPLKVENRFTGMLAVTFAQPGHDWTPQDLQLLTIVASSSAGVIEQARLRVEAHERRRLAEEAETMQRELNQARDIQMSLVPARPLREGAWEAMGRIVPAREVGGDAFDYFLLGPGRIGVAIADVSGKGTPAALLMSSVLASLRAFCDGRNPIADAVKSINHSVLRSASSGKFITFFYAEIDLVRGRLFYSNAGHNYPLLKRRDGSLVELTVGGLPLGIIDDSAYPTGEESFGAGDALLLYSDGISEALDRRNEEYGEDRLKAFWSRHAASLPLPVIDGLFADVEKFRGRAVQSDDMTVVVVAEHGGA